MGMPAAKQGDKLVATDMHIIVTPLETVVSTPHPFSGIIDRGLSSNVNIMGHPAATVNSTATNTPSHLPIGGSFQKPPANRGTIKAGSGTVFINGRAAARNGDTAVTCNDPNDLPVGKVVAVGTVNIG
jgi:uncharacterized Zn-binding protein involved in type VI secretion